MDKKIAMFAVLMFAAVFSIMTVDFASAQTSDIVPDGEGKYGDGEGKSCPSKEKKEASIEQPLL